MCPGGTTSSVPPLQTILNRCCCRSNHFWAVNLKIVLTFRQFADHPHANPAPEPPYIFDPFLGGIYTARERDSQKISSPTASERNAICNEHLI